VSPGTPATSPSSSGERPTIQDVAAAAGVSVATVSRALRGLPNVAVPTRTRVEAAARLLDYRPDPHASRLAAGRSRCVAVVVPFINSWYFANVIAGVEAVCRDCGYDLLVVTAPTTGTSESAVATIDRRVDGMIFVEVALGDEDIEALDRLGLGVVTIGQRTARFASVSVDNIEVGRLAMAHLVELGHTRIGILAGQAEDPVNFDVPGDRIAGARLALGHEIDGALVAPGQFTVEGGRRAAAMLLEARPLPTAIFALSDEMAFGALIAARELALTIPGDVSLVGVDDHEIAQVMGLTTVRQHVVDHGARAADMLLRRLAGEAGSAEVAHEVRPLELVVRTSTGRHGAGA
jgi:DNA-binding LacI/PurR family transcriptional regulator